MNQKARKGKQKQVPLEVLIEVLYIGIYVLYIYMPIQPYVGKKDIPTYQTISAYSYLSDGLKRTSHLISHHVQLAYLRIALTSSYIFSNSHPISHPIYLI